MRTAACRRNSSYTSGSRSSEALASPRPTASSIWVTSDMFGETIRVSLHKTTHEGGSKIWARGTATGPHGHHRPDSGRTLRRLGERVKERAAWTSADGQGEG